MYIFIAFIVICLIAGSIIIYSENKKSKTLEKEKIEGKWDFIKREYIPYLESHQQKIKRSTKLSFRIDYHSYSWTLDGELIFNPAGVYIAYNETKLQNAPTHAFIWGKDRPSRFSPDSVLYYHSIEKNANEEIVLNLKTKEELKEANYTLIIKNAESILYEELVSVFN